jgi:hypothetical protein
MALIGNERIYVTGVINGGLAAQNFSVTTQNIANLANGNPSPLTGLEPVWVRGVSPTSGQCSILFRTTTGAIAALGSIAPSTLAGTEVTLIGPPETGSAPASVYEQVTTLQIANS